MWLTYWILFERVGLGTVGGPPYTGGPGQTTPVAPPLSVALCTHSHEKCSWYLLIRTSIQHYFGDGAFTPLVSTIHPQCNTNTQCLCHNYIQKNGNITWKIPWKPPHVAGTKQQSSLHRACYQWWRRRHTHTVCFTYCKQWKSGCWYGSCVHIQNDVS